MRLDTVASLVIDDVVRAPKDGQLMESVVFLKQRDRRNCPQPERRPKLHAA